MRIYASNGAMLRLNWRLIRPGRNRWARFSRRCRMLNRGVSRVTTASSRWRIPTLLADEINLDSPQELKDLMARTAQNPPVRNSAGTLLLLGISSNTAAGRPGGGGGGGSGEFGGGGGALDYEAMLNSRSGRIHVFPVVAPNAELAFYNFQARGGFLVSAARNAGGVYCLDCKPGAMCRAS